MSEQPETWQPIETAPKDGRTVLLWWTTRGAGTGGYVVEGDDLMACGWRGDQDLCIPRDQKHCTHWMPLPLPPQTAPQGYDKLWDTNAHIDERPHQTAEPGQHKE